jgi:hypothetical protein
LDGCLGEPLFLVVEDDNCVHVYASPEAAAIAIEALDVDVVTAAFDDDARPYRVEWIRPNRHGKTLGILPWSVNGEYRFVPAGGPNPASLLATIRGATGILPQSMKHSVEELERRLTRR